MSDSTLLLLKDNWKLLEIVDAHWARDFLPADDMDIPHDLDVPLEDGDMDRGGTELKEDEKWTDLELEIFDATLPSN